MSNLITVFYSWQSDLDEECNNRAIRRALNESIPKLEEANPKVKVTIDEATSNLPGSPNIPAAIFEKITVADIFVADITTINPDYGGRKTPNPNVLVELGFAIAKLGWPRIILLYNTNIGTFPDDVPFDFDRQRISAFKVVDKTDGNGKGNLRGMLIEAIGSIIQKNPPRADMFSEKAIEQTRKKRDTETLRKILSTLHLPLFDKFLAEAPKFIDTSILHFYEGFHAMISTGYFHLYDKKAYDLLRSIDEHWTKSLSYDHSYRDSSIEHVQVFGSSTQYWKRETDPKKREEQAQDYYKMKERESEEFEMLEGLIKQLKCELHELLTHVKENYIEINLDETTQAAIDEHKEFHK